MQRSFNILFLLCALAGHAEAEPVSNYNIIARLTQAPGNITATGAGRIIMSQHQFYEPQYSVVERHADNSLTPFPNKELNDRTSPSDLKLDSVLGIRTDVNGVVWMLDDGMRSGVTPKLVGWDTKADRLHRVIYLPVPIAPRTPSSMILRSIADTTASSSLIRQAARMQRQTYEACDFKPPYPTWPFTLAAFETAIGFSPRQLLKACEAYRQRCADIGKVSECVTFALNERGTEADNTPGKGLDEVFARELTAAIVSGLKDAENEDRLRELFERTLWLFEKHLDLPDDIDVEVQSDLRARKPLFDTPLSSRQQACVRRRSRPCRRRQRSAGLKASQKLVMQGWFHPTQTSSTRRA
ncbi:MAG: hypothetical protein ACR2KT_17890 [Methylocella sp.]